MLSRTVDVDIDRVSLAVVDDVIDPVRDSDLDLDVLPEETVDDVVESETGTVAVVEADCCDSVSVERAVSLEAELGDIPVAELPGADSDAVEPVEVAGPTAELSTEIDEVGPP